MLEGSIIGPFGIGGKAAGGKFAVSQVIPDTFAAYPLFGARLVAAIA
jgi:hypothetical protein